MEVDVIKIVLENNINNLVYGYGNDVKEYEELISDIYDNVEMIASEIYKQRYLEEAIKRNCKPAYDGVGTRYVKCVHCGKVDSSNKFITYGDICSCNEGICNICYDEFERSNKNDEALYSDIVNYLDSCNPTVSRIKG